MATLAIDQCAAQYSTFWLCGKGQVQQLSVHRFCTPFFLAWRCVVQSSVDSELRLTGHCERVMSDRSNLPSNPADDDTNERQPTRPMAPVTPTSGTRRRPAEPQATPRQETPGVRSAAPYVPPASSYAPPSPPAGSPYAVPVPTSRRKSGRSRRDSGLYLPWWSLLIMLALVVGLAFGALVVVGSLGGQASPGGTTPIFVILTATFTVGPPASATPIPEPPTLTPPPPLPTIAPAASLPPGDLTIGATVQVIGTGPAGLNVHSGPSVSFTVRFLAHDGEKYVIKEGPQQADGEEWWHIQDPNNPNDDGWAVRRYLTIAQS